MVCLQQLTKHNNSNCLFTTVN